MLSIVPSVIALGLAMIVAIILTLRRPLADHLELERVAAANALLLAVVLQTLHFAEEAMTGFHQRFPELFGLPAMSFTFFVGFNLSCIVIWIISVYGIRIAWRIALFPAWFLAIAGSLNGVIHPVMAIESGGYFPGLLSSPFIGAAGVWVWVRLLRATVS